MANNHYPAKQRPDILGIVVYRSPIGGAMTARLGGNEIIVVVQSPAKTKDSMPFLHHNGLDVSTEAEVEVDAAYEIAKRDAEKWGLHKITRPVIQHAHTVSIFGTRMTMHGRFFPIPRVGTAGALHWVTRRVLGT
jgi:hypothetical protein